MIENCSAQLLFDVSFQLTSKLLKLVPNESVNDSVVLIESIFISPDDDTLRFGE